MKKRILAVLLALVLAAGLVWSGFVYFDFVSRTIYDESTAHLTEIFHQANQTLYNLVSVNWSQMRMWKPYLETAENEQDIVDYIRQAQKENHFTNFYFISRNGEYLTLDGRRGYLDLRGQLADLILDKQPIVANSVVPDKPEIMVFAIATEKCSYRGFDYEAIAITYNNSDLVEALRISAFGGQASTFAVLPDGRVVVDNSSDNMESMHNFFALLEKSDNLTHKEIETLQARFLAGESGTMMFAINGRSYYLVYEPANFQNWVVLGVAPADVVNASMSKLQSATMLVVSGIAVTLAAALLMLVVQQNRLRLKQKDKELLARDELFSKLSINVDDVFLMLNPETLQVDYVSPNVEKLLGLSEAEVRADVRTIGRMEVGDSAPVDGAHLSQMSPDEQMEWDREYLHRKSGEIRLFHVAAFVSDIQGDKKYIVDLSDRTNDRKLNQALQIAVQTAENANQSKSVFLSRMSHDIRTPMNAIVGFSKLLDKDAEDPEKVREYTRKITASSSHLLGLVNDVLDMSRIESGKTTLNLTEETISKLVLGIDTVIRTQTNAKNQTLEIDADRIIHDAVIVDLVRLTQICMNLLSNAVKYTQEGGHIQFTIAECSVSGNTALYEIVVQDNGYGMSKDFLDKIFDSFTREEDSRTSRIQGTGLGMAITKSLVDLMGGTIRVQSEKGAGSRFTVDIPLRIHSEAAAQASGESPEAAAGQQQSPLCGLHILAAEDNELNAEILEAVLELEGATCEICANGKLALDAFLLSRPGQYDLILMDVQMPVMNGYEAVSSIRSSGHPMAKTIPIVAMTANAFAEDVQNALDAGMNSHVAKPLDMGVLKEAVKQAFSACAEG